MKKALLTILCVLFLQISTTANANDIIKVFLNGKQIAFDVNPVIENGRTLVQMRKICDDLNIEVDWNPDLRTITMTSPDANKIIMSIDNPQATVNNQKVSLDAPPSIYNDYTFVPLRVIGDVFGIEVEWHGDYNTVSLLTDNSKIIKNSINLPDPSKSFVNTTLESTEDDELLYCIKNLGDVVDGLDAYVNLCKTYGYQTICERCTLDENKGVEGIAIYDTSIPNRVINLGYAYNKESKDARILITYNKACWIYKDSLMQLVLDDWVNPLINEGWSAEKPFIGKDYWIHKSRATSDLPITSKIKGYTHIKVIDYAEVEQVYNPNTLAKEIKKLLIEVNGEKRTCSTDLISYSSDELTGLRQRLDDMSSILHGSVTVLDVHPKTFYNLTDVEWDIVYQGIPIIGMPKHLFLIMQGAPDDINTYTSANGSTEQYVYYNNDHSSDYYYFENGFLQSYQD